MTRYREGELRIVRYALVSPNEPKAYIVEEIATSRRVNKDLMMESDALLLMREMGSPYVGKRYGKTWIDQMVEDAMSPVKEAILEGIRVQMKPTLDIVKNSMKPTGWY